MARASIVIVSWNGEAFLQECLDALLEQVSPDDEIIPYRHGRALYDAAKPPKQFLELSGGHNEGFIFVRESWVQALGEFLNRCVGGAEKHDLNRRAN